MNDPGASCRGIEYKMQQTHKNTNSHPAASCEEFFRLKDESIIVIANDPTNEGRYLLLLQKKGLIKLKDVVDILPTITDM